MARPARPRGRTYVRAYAYRRKGGGGTVRVSAHPTRYRRGPPPEFVVLYRSMNRPHGIRHTWAHTGPFASDRAAERRRKALMAQGYHAVVERSAGREGSTGARTLERLARGADDRRADRRPSRRARAHRSR
jgi:hypothetical protein